MNEFERPSLRSVLLPALECRASLLSATEPRAVRLFHGFLEGIPALSIEAYGDTLVFFDRSPAGDSALVRAAMELTLERYPWFRTALWKVRKARETEARCGVLLRGTKEELCTSVQEGPVRYALELTMHQDTSFYLDTRLLRAWLLEHTRGKSVLNLFAYTGSLGVAARVAGARRVVQVDRDRTFLSLARRSLSLQKLSVARDELQVTDVFPLLARMRKAETLFDVVLVDAPFFSDTASGRVELEEENFPLLQKVRPLVADGGVLLVVNNAVFVSGEQFQRRLEHAARDGYLTLEDRIGVPEDCLGYASTRKNEAMVSPAPFVHSTKIALLRVRRKDGRKASM